MKMKIFAFLVICNVLQQCMGANFLGIVAMPSRSHNNIVEKLLIELTKRGHEATFVTYYKAPKPTAKIKEVILPDLYQEMTSKMNLNNNPNEATNAIQIRNSSKAFFTFLGTLMGATYNEMILSTPQIQKLIKENEKYDAVLGETLLLDNILAGFAYKSNASIISISGAPSFYARNPSPASYIPNLFLGFPSRMNFWERVINTFIGFLSDLTYRFIHLRMQDAVMRKYFGEDLPPLGDIVKNTSLTLVHHHHILTFPRPVLPNVIEIGGYHIDPPKELPPNLKKYLDKSKEGAILFSLGSFVKSADLPKEQKQEILRAFSRLKQNVLWKFEDDALTGLPENVKIVKWLPQSDILAHPNLKLFITHGGLLSLIETVARGVPIIGIPVVADQPANMKYATNAGFGLTLNLDSLTEDVLYEAVTEVLNNPVYRQNAKKGSELMLDRPLPVVDTAIFWIEYVIRHKGAPHLRSAARDLTWYQLYLLDVLAIIFIFSFLVLLVSIMVTKFFVKRFLNKNVKVSKVKKED